MQKMLKKTYLVALVVIFIALIFITIFVIKAQKDKINVSMPSNSEENDGGTLFSGNLQDLLSFGKAQKCTWKIEDGSSGKIYTDGTRSYSEVNNIPVADPNSADAIGADGKQSETVLSSMYTITDGGYFYSWSSVSNEGMKIKIEDQETGIDQNSDTELIEESDSNSNSGNNPSQNNYDYKCSAWSVDASKFNLPSDKIFKDFSAMMNVQYNSEDVNKICDMLEGTDKEACINDFATSQK